MRQWYFSGMKHSGWGERGKRDDMCRWYLPRTSQLMEETGRVDDVGRWYLPRISQLMDDRKSIWYEGMVSSRNEPQWMGGDSKDGWFGAMYLLGVSHSDGRKRGWCEGMVSTRNEQQWMVEKGRVDDMNGDIFLK